MLKALAVGLLAGFVVLGAPALARAGGGGDQGNQNGQGDNAQGNQGSSHGGRDAPEPLTVLGLLAGAGGVAFWRWRASRKSPAR
jgi:hypothetical protein